MRRALLVAMLALLASGGAACQLLAGFETFEGVDAATGDAANMGDAATGDAKLDPADASAPKKCSAALGRSKIDEPYGKALTSLQLVEPVPGDGPCFWVDRTEVTVAQYRRFLAERPSGAFQDQDRCSWKRAPSDPMSEPEHACTVNARKEESDPFDPEKPIRCVDWCDAREFCRWAGKDLCRTASYFGVADPASFTEEWGIACSPERNAYPYGSRVEYATCNVGLTEGACNALLGPDGCLPVRPGTFFPKCIGTDGALDMVGNVAEWVLSCVFGDGGPETNCATRGGSYASSATFSTCHVGNPEFAPRSARRETIGFRCCSPLTPGESERAR